MSVTEHALPRPRPAGRLRALGSILVVVALVVVTAAASSARAHFAYKKVEVGTGRFPTTVAVGDFNKDGKRDLVVARDRSSSVALLLGKGHGRFEKAKQLTTETDDDPRSVAVGDINGDKKPDIIAANHLGRSVSVLIGKGNGTFYPPVLRGVGTHPRGVAVADLNGGHHLDIVTANAASDDISVLDGTGCGWPVSPASCTTSVRFRREQTFALPHDSHAFGIAIGDLNGDKAPDIAVNDTGGQGVTLFRNTGGSGAHGFAKRVSVKLSGVPLSEWIGIADLDRDGHPDVVTSGIGIHVILDAGTFSRDAVVKTVGNDNFRGLAMGRLDKDKWTDIVVYSQSASHLVVLRGTGDASLLSRSKVLHGSSSTAPALVANLDKHGRPDIVSVNENWHAIEVFLAE